MYISEMEKVVDYFNGGTKMKYLSKSILEEIITNCFCDNCKNKNYDCDKLGDKCDNFVDSVHDILDMSEQDNDKSNLGEICKALGWQGATIHQVIDEIKRLRGLK